MNIINTKDFTKEFITEIFSLAKDIEKSPNDFQIKNKIVGTLFFEPSTRTRWSSEAAILKLGGHELSMESAKDCSSDKKGESLADTFKTCSQYVDVLVVRHPDNDAIENATKYSDVPVINAGSGYLDHPTQALIDLYTILQYFPNLNGQSIIFTGDIMYSRTIVPLINIINIYGNTINKIFHSDGVLGYPSTVGTTSYYYGKQIYHQLPKIDILYMTRHQKERGEDREKPKFIMTYEFAEVMKKEAIIMHPLPRNEELDPSTDSNHRAVYFKQAKNGLWIRMALLYKLLNSN